MDSLSRREDRPQIPATAHTAPTSGGLVIPYITLCHSGRRLPVWGVNDPLRVAHALRERLCQICGHPLRDLFIAIIRPADFLLGICSEPGCHPECSKYSRAGCPMLAGTTNAYRSQPSPNSRPCGDPRCLCRAWSHTPSAHQRYGNPAEAWYAAWIRLSDYQLIHTPATDEHPVLDGIKLRGNVIRKIDKIRDAAGADAGQRTALDNLGMWLRMSRLMHGQGS